MSILALLRRETRVGRRAKSRYAPDRCPRCGGGMEKIVDWLDPRDGRALAVCKCGEFYPDKTIVARKGR